MTGIRRGCVVAFGVDPRRARAPSASSWWQRPRATDPAKPATAWCGRSPSAWPPRWSCRPTSSFSCPPARCPRRRRARSAARPPSDLYLVGPARPTRRGCRLATRARLWPRRRCGQAVQPELAAAVRAPLRRLARRRPAARRAPPLAAGRARPLAATRLRLRPADGEVGPLRGRLPHRARRGPRAPAPGRAALVLCSNHASYMDTPVLMAALPFTTSCSWRRRRSSAIPSSAPTSGARATSPWTASTSSRACKTPTLVQRAVAAGEKVLLFPEGTFTAAAGLRPFRLGRLQGRGGDGHAHRAHGPPGHTPGAARRRPRPAPGTGDALDRRAHRSRRATAGGPSCRCATAWPRPSPRTAASLASTWWPAGPSGRRPRLTHADPRRRAPGRDRSCGPISPPRPLRRSFAPRGANAVAEARVLAAHGLLQGAGRSRHPDVARLRRSARGESWPPPPATTPWASRSPRPRSAATPTRRPLRARIGTPGQGREAAHVPRHRPRGRARPTTTPTPRRRPTWSARAPPTSTPTTIRAPPPGQGTCGLEILDAAPGRGHDPRAGGRRRAHRRHRHRGQGAARPTCASWPCSPRPRPSLAESLRLGRPLLEYDARPDPGRRPGRGHRPHGLGAPRPDRRRGRRARGRDGAGDGRPCSPRTRCWPRPRGPSAWPPCARVLASTDAWSRTRAPVVARSSTRLGQRGRARPRSACSAPRPEACRYAGRPAAGPGLRARARPACSSLAGLVAGACILRPCPGRRRRRGARRPLAVVLVRRHRAAAPRGAGPCSRRPFPSAGGEYLLDHCDHYDRLPRRVAPPLRGRPAALPPREAHHGRGSRGHRRAAAARGRLRGHALRWAGPTTSGTSSPRSCSIPRSSTATSSFGKGDELAGQAHPWGTIILSVPSLLESFDDPDDALSRGHPRVRAPARRGSGRTSTASRPGSTRRRPANG